MTFIVDTTTQRWRILIQGIVQGVGFRPFVYGQALQWGLGGFVLNDSMGVTIEVEGSRAQLEGFQRALREKTPPLARIDVLTREVLTIRNETQFRIAQSEAGDDGNERQALIAPDTATCADCLRELFDPADRRHRYPFINCTNCGPRFSIIQNVPYDRAQTTMRVFPMCPDCQAEYDNPLSRRFHAQPNACPVCGPRMRLLDETGQEILGEEPIILAARQLAQGHILAIKGVGGYHLACDALHVDAVAQLRARKRREAKPFALMVPNLETARQLCVVSDEEARLLQSYRRPIVLLQKRADELVAPAIAPAYDTLGIMLPYAPQHYLLLAAFMEIVGPGRPIALVMTSGNLSDEPIAYRDEDARRRLLGIAAGMLTHNRDIHMRCDDSVTRIVAGGEQFARRSRGYAPEPVTLGFPCPRPIVACGGQLKNTYCLGKGRQAFVSHHIGDLENMETLQSFQEGIAHFAGLFGIQPAAIAYDLHPEYLATKYALDSSIKRKIGVQHHYAHIASVLAEHQLAGPVLGIAADGTGYGTDGALWGCELMRANLNGFERLAHLAYVPLPGGEQAVRQPWRMAAVYLQQAYGEDFLALDIPFVHELDRKGWRILDQMIARHINAPPTSSLGRLFDAIAALLGVHSQVVYEGQAAIELEARAETQNIHLYPFSISEGEPVLLDVRPMIRAIVEELRQGVASERIAGSFHWTVAEMLAASCVRAREQTGLRTVALSGGVFQNRMLLERLVERLGEQAFQVYVNRRVPANDGGISLGQLAIAAARLANDT
ncbi:MAG: carbamoyltransferase HypF [Ktedonobacteraceae bacterium]